MRVSVVLCTYSPDVYEHFRKSADSVLSQTYDDVELVIVVDGSQAVGDCVAADYGVRDSVVTHINADNRGLLGSRNRGAKLATGEVVAFIDDDAVADSRWIEELVGVYESDDILAAGGRMVPEWVAGRPKFLPEEYYWLVGVTHRGFADGPREVRNTFGSNISFRREVFLDLDGFDTNVGGRKREKNLQGGETELCARLRRHYDAGVYYNPEAVVSHNVFDYRTAFCWLLDRAFWQGYSKYRMAQLVPDAGGEENRFLIRLLRRHLPRRLRVLIMSPSWEGLNQLVSLFIFTAAVGAGYLYALFSSLFRRNF